MTAQPSGKGGVKSDRTLFSIIELLQERDGAGVTELAEQLGLAKSSVHKHLRTMEEYGYVVNRDGVYRVGLQFFKVGEYARNEYDVYHAAKPGVRQLAADTGEMSWVMTHENGRAMYLFGDGGATEVNVDSVIGTWTDMHCNSGGKAMLAHLPRSRVESILDRHGLPARSENTITDRAALFDALDRIRDRGFALNLGEDLEGIHAVGVPLVFEDAVKGALTIAGPAHRLTEERCETELAERLQAAANDVELAIAYN